MRLIKSTTKILTIIFALIGLGVMVVYVGVNLHLTNTKGIIDKQAESFWQNGKQVGVQVIQNDSSNVTFFSSGNYCFLKILKSTYPGEFRRILNLALNNNQNLALKNLDVVVNSSGFDTDNRFINLKSSCESSLSGSVISKADFILLGDMVDMKSPFLWANAPEWEVFKVAVAKDKDVIARVEKETGVKGRVIVSELVAEQMRTFYSYRAWFEQALSPAKVLGSMSQFSWGVMGIKEDTAINVENNLKDKNSPFYTGPVYENLLNFTTSNVQDERYQRLINPDDHYYDYLYAALYNKEIITQWKNSGVDISGRPEVLATLYNIGFAHSKPNSDPQMGGAELTINGNIYSFGRIAYEFYYSGELNEEFPQ